MPRSLAFILGLLDRHAPAFAAAEDFGGGHGPALRLWQRRGFLSREPERHPVPSCPHCKEGTRYLLGGRCVCGDCLSLVDARHLLRWRFDLEAFLAWLAWKLRLRGDVLPVDERLWQLGSFPFDGTCTECFFARSGPLPERAVRRLLAYRSALLLQAVPGTPGPVGFRGIRLLLSEVLRPEDRALKVADLTQLLRQGGAVRFDRESGALWLGDLCLGEVPLGSKKYHLLACLAEQQDRFVPYGDLKHEVLRRSGSTDITDEASFCQKLKSRAKKGVPAIDRVVAPTNKGDGYRLRAAA